MTSPLRFVTAASLFDGHDVSINIMRRILQAKGAEVIHLGHNRSALEVVDAAICEDAHAVAISSYQGGHMEYFPYLRKLLDERGGKQIKIFGGGGGVITAEEIKSLERQGVTKIYSPADGVSLGLEGIIDDMLKRANFDTLKDFKVKDLLTNNPIQGRSLTPYEIAKCISGLENSLLDLPIVSHDKYVAPVLGITGTGGAGKSSLIDELLTRFRHFCPQLKIALISIDPTRRKTQGALLGDGAEMEFDCGTGAGGFKEGNTCATGGDEQEERRRDRIEGTDEEVKVERQKTNRIISRAKKFIEDGKKYSEAAKRNMDAAATNEKLISKYKEYKDKFNDGKFDKEYSEATKRATEYYKAASEYSQKAKGLFDKALKEESRARARREKGFEEIEPSSENLEVKKKESELADNCGTGAGGFQPGNTCAGGGGEEGELKPKFKPSDIDIKIDADDVIGQEYVAAAIARDKS